MIVMTTSYKNIITTSFIDITSEVCPLTFVKTKLALENLKIGDVLEIRLKGREPIENIPLSAKEHGHKILKIEPEDADDRPFGVHKLFIQKKC